MAALCGLFVCLAASAEGTPARWIRTSSVSPDGKTVAFSYQGDIWTVPVKGGEAKRITSNPAYDSTPQWSADGKTIVFTSYRELSKDIYSVPAEGGSPKRLTKFSGAETLLTVTPDGKVLFAATAMTDAKYSEFPGDPQVYSVPLAGGKATLVTPVTFSAATANAAGTILYEDYKGYEDALRKHHTSSVTRDIWMLKDGKYTKLTSYEGTDISPVFAADGDTFYYLSEKPADWDALKAAGKVKPGVTEDPYAKGDGADLNIWKSSVSNPSQAVKLTNFVGNPVRYPSVASDGTLVFSYNGDLYTMREGSEPQKIEITITKDDDARALQKQTINESNISSAAISPNGKEAAIVARGDVYVTSIEYKTTRRITNTPQQERGVDFSEDGRTIYYASERDGEWAIWKSELKNKDDKYFTYAYDFEETRVTDKGQTCQMPDVSPDGKKLAFFRNRNELVVKDIKSGKETVAYKDFYYSYSDGDFGFEWSPDSHYILVYDQSNGGWNNLDISLIDLDENKVTNLTETGYSVGGFRWALGGKAITFSCDKYGNRSHGSWGADDDIYAMFFDAKAYEEFMRDKEGDAIAKLLADDKKKDEKKDTAKAEKVKKLDLDLANREFRTVRLTSRSGAMGDHLLSEDGTKLYFIQALEKGRDLCVLDLKSHSIKVLQKGVYGSFTVSPDGKDIYLGVSKIDLNSGTMKPISVSGDFDYQPAAEREYMFEHVWKQVSEKFYDAGIHGIDWKGYHDNYAQFLPYITNNFDFVDLLSEMLGELNGSHTGARYYYPASLNTGYVGLLFDETDDKEGALISDVLPGGAVAVADPEIKAGDRILAVDGKKIAADENWYEAFAQKSGKRVQLTVKKGHKEVNLFVMASSSDSDLLYRRWVKHNEDLVAELSGGKIGYVHVKGMNSESFRTVFSKLLGKYRGCDAVVVDTRHNGGGWLHEDLAVLLSGKKYMDYSPRGRHIGDEPFMRWNKPSCLLVGEDNYSDASGFPYIYQALGLGKLIGAPVPGTMTAVWWEYLVDQTIVFGIPEVTNIAVAKNRPLENMQIEPDILVYNTPEKLIQGEDEQLKVAVNEMLKEINALP